MGGSCILLIWRREVPYWLPFEYFWQGTEGQWINYKQHFSAVGFALWPFLVYPGYQSHKNSRAEIFLSGPRDELISVRASAAASLRLSSM